MSEDTNTNSLDGSLDKIISNQAETPAPDSAPETEVAGGSDGGEEQFPSNVIEDTADGETPADASGTDNPTDDNDIPAVDGGETAAKAGDKAGQPDSALWKQLGFGSMAEMIAAVERAKIYDSQAQKPQTQQQKPRAIAGYDDGDYPHVPLKQSKLPPEELAVRRERFAAELVDNFEEAALLKLGPALTRWLDLRDHFKETNNAMGQDKEFLASHGSLIRAYEERGLSQQDAYALAKVAAETFQKKAPPAKAPAKKPAKVEKVRDNKDFPKPNRLSPDEWLDKAVESKFGKRK